MPIVRNALRKAMPAPLLSMYRLGRAMLQRRRFRGDKYYCNICDTHLRSWIHAGDIHEGNRICPVCYSFGRQRFLALVLDREVNLRLPYPAGSILHFAPELGLQRWVKDRMRAWRYRSADLYSLGVDLNLDVQNIDLADDSIDIVLLSHVMEHVDNDIRAIKEIYRILAPGGKLFVQVPLSGGAMTLDERVASAEMRLARYGKTDHVRLYGDDILERIMEPGFEVMTYRATDRIFSGMFDYMALDIPSDSTLLYASESTTYVCRKPA